MILWSHNVHHLEITLLAGKKQLVKLSQPLVGAMVHLSPTLTIPLDQLHSVLGGWLREHSLRALTHSNSFTFRRADIHFNISVPLRTDATLRLPDGKEVHISWIQGIATVRAILVTLDHFKIGVHAANKVFDFSCADESFPHALTGEVPRKDAWTFTKGLIEEPSEHLNEPLLSVAVTAKIGGTGSDIPLHACRGILNLKLNKGSCPVAVAVFRPRDLPRLLAMHPQ